MKCLLDSLSAPNRYKLLKIESSFRNTVLHVAVLDSHVEIIRCILKSVLRKDRYKLLKVQQARGGTCLHLAATQGGTDKMKCMLNSVTSEERFGLLKVQSEGNTVLHLAAHYAHTDIINCVPESVSPATQVQLLNSHNWSGKNVLETAVMCYNETTANCIRQWQTAAEGHCGESSGNIAAFNNKTKN